MKLELRRNLEYSEALSRETPAFSATLTVNGQPRGTVPNAELTHPESKP